MTKFKATYADSEMKVILSNENKINKPKKNYTLIDEK